MIVKVCGNVYNIHEVASLNPDMMGFIFYDKSPRHITNNVTEVIHNIPAEVQRVGVFVDASENEIDLTCRFYDLHTVQLHGNESPDFCQKIKDKGYAVYKAFGIKNKEDFDFIKPYGGYVDMIVLDTKTNNHGGSGKKFDWNLLDNYPLKIPYLLSGGISPADAEILCQSAYPWMAGVDVNSRFEINPGNKDISRLSTFIKKIRTR